WSSDVCSADLKEDPSSVPNRWKQYFDELDGTDSIEELKEEAQKAGNGTPASVKRRDKEDKAADKKKEEDRSASDGTTLEKIKGVSYKIFEDMDDSHKIKPAMS